MASLAGVFLGVFPSFPGSGQACFPYELIGTAASRDGKVQGELVGGEGTVEMSEPGWLAPLAG